MDASNNGGANSVPDAYDKSKSHAPGMLTTDIALKMDPNYATISKRFLDHPDQFADAFAKRVVQAHASRHGPASRYLGPLVPKETLIWQDPVPAVDHELVNEQDVAALKAKILSSGLSLAQLVNTAWASASTFRGSDKRGGANGARIRLSPQKDWEVNEPAELGKVLPKLEAIQKEFNSAAGGKKKVSLADLIVMGGDAAIEEAAKKGGNAVKIPFSPGRTDASQSQTDVSSFAVLEPASDGFRNYLSAGQHRPAEELLVDRAQLLKLTAPEMTVLVGGLRALNANFGKTKHGVLTDRPETLTNDFFVNLLDMKTQWKATPTPRTVRSPRSRHRHRKMDRHPRRPRLRLQLPTPRHRRTLRLLRLRHPLRPGLRLRLAQSHEQRPLRPGAKLSRSIIPSNATSHANISAKTKKRRGHEPRLFFLPLDSIGCGQISGYGGGGGGIRTPETLSGLTVFKTAGFNRSPTPPSPIIPTSAALSGNSIQSKASR